MGSGDLSGGIMTFADFLLATVVICTYSKDQLLYRVRGWVDGWVGW
jgi:hypothetical protein